MKCQLQYHLCITEADNPDLADTFPSVLSDYQLLPQSVADRDIPLLYMPQTNSHRIVPISLFVLQSPSEAV